MTIDKALYAAPQGLDALQGGMPSDEIQIEYDPAPADIFGMDIDFGGGIGEDVEDTEDFNKNLAEDMDERVLATLASELLADFDEDINSRKDWIKTYVDGLELLGMKIEERTEPWDGACGVFHPMLSEALVKFQSETMMSTFPAAGPVKTQIIGKETPAKKEAASRVQEDMNYQLLEVMTEYRPEHERMLWGLGLAGNAFKKVYYDPYLERQVSLFVPAEDLVVPYGASNLDTAPRVTHVMRKTENELKRLQYAGFYRDIDLGEPSTTLDEVEKKIAERMGFRATSDDRFKLLEIQVDLDLDGYKHKNEGKETGIALPYIVTLEKSTAKVLAIRRNWEPDDETHTKRQHFVHYGYIPGFGFYHFGLIHLIGAYAKSSTSLLRQLVDAGTLSNLPGGFKTRGMRVKGDDTPIGPGEWRDVDIPSGALRDNLMPLPYKEPSQTLMTLLQGIIEEGRRFANTADLQISDMSGQAPVGTTLAILERTLKTMSAVQARVHYSMRQELKLLKGIIAAYTPDNYSYDPETGNRRAKREDYDDVDVIPVSDPNASTMAQKIVQYQAVMQLAQTAPQLYNLPLLHRQMVEVLGAKNAEKLIPMDEDQKPTDPVSENQNMLKMKPVKAFLTQDHQAHITVHMAAMNDPMLQQMMQNNPMAQQLMQAMHAHINEHLGFAYRRQIEQQMGMSMPPQFDESGEEVYMDPAVEARLAPVLAQAAQRLLAQNSAQVQQQQAQQQMQDPLVQMQMQELQIKAQEQQRKAAKDQIDAQLAARKLEIEQQRVLNTQKSDTRRIAIDGLKSLGQIKQTTMQRQHDGKKHTISVAADALKHLHSTRTDMTKHAQTLAHQRAQQERQAQQQAQQKQPPAKDSE